MPSPHGPALGVPSNHSLQALLAMQRQALRLLAMALRRVPVSTHSARTAAASPARRWGCAAWGRSGPSRETYTTVRREGGASIRQKAHTSSSMRNRPVPLSSEGLGQGILHASLFTHPASLFTHPAADVLLCITHHTCICPLLSSRLQRETRSRSTAVCHTLTPHSCITPLLDNTMQAVHSVRLWRHGASRKRLFWSETTWPS